MLKGRLHPQLAATIKASQTYISKVMSLPKPHKVGIYKHRRLIKYLRFCPESKVFLWPRNEVNRSTHPHKMAKEMVMEMVFRNVLNANPFPSIKEADRASMEYSQKSFRSEERAEGEDAVD